MRSTQHRVYTRLAAFQNEHGHPPTVRELAQTANLGVSSTHTYLRRLYQEGVIERDYDGRYCLTRRPPPGTHALTPSLNVETFAAILSALSVVLPPEHLAAAQRALAALARVDRLDR